jgi:hypothetical protein
LTGHVWVAALCIWSFFRERRETGGKAQAWLWLVLAVPVMLLAVHHSTGLGAAVTDLFRQEAREEGWYGARRSFQRQLIRLIVPLGFGALALLVWLLRKSWRRYLPAALALVVLSGFGAVQLISLHDVDARMHAHWLGARLDTWLNAIGLLLAAGALCWSYAEGLQQRARPVARPRPIRRA